MPLEMFNILSFIKFKNYAITSDIGQQTYLPLPDGDENL